MFKCDASVLISAIQELSALHSMTATAKVKNQILLAPFGKDKIVLMTSAQYGAKDDLIHMQAVVPGSGSIPVLQASSSDLVSIKRLIGSKAGTEVRLDHKQKGAEWFLHVEASGKSASVEAYQVVDDDARMQPRERFADATQVNVAMLRDLVTPTISVVSTDTTRAHLSKLFVSAGKGRWIAVATDGHRLSSAQAKASTPVPFTKLVHRPVAETVLGWANTRSTASIVFSIKHGKQKGERGTDDCSLMLTRADKTGLEVSFYLAQMDAQFPDYTQVIPSVDSMRTALKVNTQRAKASLEVVKQAMAGRRTDGVTFGVLGDRMAVGHTFSYDNEGIRRFFCELDGQVVRNDTPGEERQIGVSAAYLLDGLAHFADEQFTMYFAEPLDPILLVGEHGSALVTNVVMPMRNGHGSGLEHYTLSSHHHLAVSSKDLAEGAAFAASCTQPKSTMPVLSQLRVTLDSLQLRMEATDLYLSASVKLPVREIRPEGAKTMLVDAAMLSRVVKAMSKDAELNLSALTDGVQPLILRIYSPSLRLFVDLQSAMPVDNFPPLPVVSTGAPILRVSSSALRSALQSVLPHINTDETRPAQNSVLWAPQADNILRLVSTDGHGLTVSELAAEGAWLGFPTYLVPRDGVVLAIRQLADFENAPVQVSSVPPNIALSVESGGYQRVVTVKLVDSSYPAYQSVMPTGSPWATGYLDHATFKKSLAGVASVETKKSTGVSQVDMSFQAGCAKIKGKKSGASDKSVFVLDGQPFELLSVATHALADMSKSVTSDQIGIEFRGLDTPLLFQGTYGPYVNVRGVFMPAAKGVEAKPEQVTTVAELPRAPTPELAPMDSKPAQAATPRPKRPAAPKPAARLHIEDPDLFDKLLRIEGAAWRARQLRDQHALLDPNGIFTNLQAYRILKDLGPDAADLIVSDLVPSAGLIAGAEGRGYALMPDGEIVLMGETASPAIRKSASAIMTVTAP